MNIIALIFITIIVNFSTNFNFVLFTIIFDFIMVIFECFKLNLYYKITVIIIATIFFKIAYFGPIDFTNCEDL